VVIKEYLCGPLYASRDGCGYRKVCFDAEEKKTEFDALVIGDGEKCIVEPPFQKKKNLGRRRFLFVFQSVAAAVRVISINDMRIGVDGYSGMTHDALIITWNVLVCLY
jgi:hypothetical protein